jgi:hypothetical protein
VSVNSQDQALQLSDIFQHHIWGLVRYKLKNEETGALTDVVVEAKKSPAELWT